MATAKKDIKRQPKRYFSAKMAERRFRILSEALSLILKKGVDGFTLKELSERSDVALKTLYNNYGGKDEIIAIALDHYMEDQGRRMPEADPLDVDDIAEKLRLRALDFFQHREWARASNYLFYSSNCGERTYRSLRDMTMIYLRPFLAAHSDDQSLSSRIPIAIVEMQLANMAHGVVHDWLMGRISDAAAPHILVYGLLSLLLSITKGPLHDKIQTRLTQEGRLLADITES